MKHLRLIVVLCTAAALVFITIGLFGCGDNNIQNNTKKENAYIKEQMGELFSYLNDVTSMDPTAWTEIDAYLNGDFEQADKLQERIDTVMLRYDQVIKYLARSVYKEKELAAWRELQYLRDYLFLSAHYVKIALDLLQKDIRENTNSSRSLVFDIGNFYDNNYSRLFVHEYNRLAEEYGIKEIH